MRMVPSNERFQSNDPPIARIYLRLVMQHELLLVEGLAKLFDCIVALGGIEYSIHLDLREVVPVCSRPLSAPSSICTY